MRSILNLSVVLAGVVLAGLAGCVPDVPPTEIRNEAPFAHLDGRTKAFPGGWGLNNEDRAAYFRAERKRLGKDFQAALLEFLGDDMERHYWCSTFLWSKEYLGSDPPKPELALLILEQDIIICRAHIAQDNSNDNKAHLVSSSIYAAILSQTLGLKVQAAYHRAVAERLIEETPDLAAAWPATPDAERNVFNSIPYKSGKKKPQRD